MAPKSMGLTSLLILTALLLFCGCNVEPGNNTPNDSMGTREQEEESSSLALTYYGQATFLIEAGNKILIDPYSPELGYGTIDLPADLVTVSHHHFDHNYVEGSQKAKALFGLTPDGEWQQVQKDLGDDRVYTVNSYHDDQNGSRLGKNSIFVFEIAGLRLIHLGDLGHSLEENEIRQIGKADLLLVPVGGYYTLSYDEVLEVIAELSPAIVIPMHYRTEYYSDRNLKTLEDFLDQKPPYPIYAKESCITISREELPAATEIWTMEFTLP
jgi:L-ascorbate metabolism protein UlaG (beta-lactamase superfamily)